MPVSDSNAELTAPDEVTVVTAVHSEDAGGAEAHLLALHVRADDAGGGCAGVTWDSAT